MSIKAIKRSKRLGVVAEEMSSRTRHFLQLLKPYYKYVSIRTPTDLIKRGYSEVFWLTSAAGMPHESSTNNWKDKISVQRTGRHLEFIWENGTFHSQPAMWWAVKEVNSGKGCGNSHQYQISHIHNHQLTDGVYDLRFNKIRKIEYDKPNQCSSRTIPKSLPTRRPPKAINRSR